MAISKVDIFNRALSAAGSKSTITDPDGNDSREVKLCSLWYDVVRQTVMKSASWPCSVTHRTLGITAERDGNAEWADGDPAPGFRFAYHEPEDMLAPRYLHDYAPFKRSFVNGQNAINTNTERAVLCYSRDEPLVSNWDLGLVESVTFTLGAYISMELTGKTFVHDRLMRQAEVVTTRHQTDVANEDEQLFDSLPSWIQAQHYEGPRHTTRYYAPYSNLNGIAP